MKIGPFDLRPHQVRAFEGLRAAIRSGKRRVLCHAVCGAGKTIVSSAIVGAAAAKGSPTLFLASGRQLIFQKAAKLEACDIPHAVLMNGEDYVSGHSTVVSSKDTLWSRAFKKDRVPLPAAKVVIVDEAHLATAESWKKIYEQYNDAILVGFTATPALGNGKALPGWDAMVSGGTYDELIAGGFLVPAKVFAPYVVDMTGVKVDSKNGEYNQAEMDARYDDKVLVGDFITQWKKYAEGRLTGFFASSVRASIGAAEEFNRAGIPAAHMDADTPQEERDAIFAKARSGAIKVITNYGVMRVGVDLPEMRCVQLAVSMNSLNTYLQTVGRGFRPFPGKTDCVIIDHGGNVHKHGWPTEDHYWSLNDDRTVQERDKDASEKERKPREPICCPECGAMREKGPKCLNCGHEHKRTGLKVRTVSGDLKPLERKKAKEKKKQTDAQKTWLTCLSMAFYRGGTFKTAAWFFKERSGEWPPQWVSPQPPEHQRGLRVRDIYPNWGHKR